MKSWSKSLFMASPYLEPWHKNELLNYRLLGMSYETLVACKQASFEIAACTSMVIMWTEGIGGRRIYLKPPEQARWVELEREAFVSTGDNFGFMVDTLH